MAAGRTPSGRWHPAQTLRTALRARPVLLRLVLSYLILVLAVGLVLSGAAFLLFQDRYNEELERLHRVYLQIMERDLRREIVEPAKTIFMECATQFLVPSPDFFGEDEVVSGNHGKLFLTYRWLRELSTKHGRTVADIHIYYRKADLLVSTSYGLKLEASAYVPGAGESWIRELDFRPAVNRWVGIEDTGSDQGEGFRQFMMVIRFPILSAVEDATVVLGVQFQTDTLRSLLERLPLQDAGATYLLDTTGRIVTTTTGAPQVASELSALLQEARDAPNGSLARTLGGVPSVIATTALGDTGWTLANVVPRTALYRRAEYVGLVLLLVSFAAIALGALAVVAISLRIYTPIGKLLRKVRSLEGPKVTHTGKGTTDELAVLGYAIDDLSTRMEELSTTVEANRVVIKHDLVTRLLSGAVTTMEEYAEAARLLGLGALHPWYRAALLMLVTDRGATSPGEARLLAYRAADQVERTGQGHVLAAAMPDGTVGMAVAESEAGQEAHRLAQTWAEPGFLSVPVRVILGCPVNVPTDLAASFAEALRVAPYAFFYTERTILHDAGDLLAREEPFSAAARTIREAFPEKLRLRRRNEVVQALGAACALVRVDHASAEVGVSVLKAISAGILEYAKDMKLEAAAPTLQGAHDLVDASRDVDDFLSRATALVDQIYAALNARANGRTSAHVEAAKQYVQEHYATALSLDRAAEVAGVSASYLSKVFRAETGVTFVSWVSAFRLERAERLLRDADKPVHEIGSSCGMNTPAYFIRQFKARYGLTPFDYRRAYRTGGPVR